MLVAVAAVSVAWLATAAPALAGKTKVYDPPGKAGANEYAEVVPSAGGNVAAPALGGGNTTARQISALGAGSVGVRKLAKLGREGAGAAQFALQTAPAATPTRLPAPTPTPARAGAKLDARAGSALAGIGRLIAGSDVDGIGLALPLLLAASLTGAVGFGVLRARRHRQLDARL